MPEDVVVDSSQYTIALYTGIAFPVPFALFCTTPVGTKMRLESIDKSPKASTPWSRAYLIKKYSFVPGSFSKQIMSLLLSLRLYSNGV